MSYRSDDLVQPVQGASVIGAQPVVGQPVVGQPVVGQPVAVAQPVAGVPAAPVVVAQPGARRTVATTYGQRFAFDSIIVGLVGLALTIVGLIAVTRGGFDGSMDEPVVDVLGFTHTTTLGLIEAAIGVCLLLCAAATTRSGAIFFGLVLGIAGVVGAVQADSFRRSLALESGHAWLMVFLAALVVLVSLLVPRMTTRTARVDVA
jgi:hypothetical protein